MTDESKPPEYPAAPECDKLSDVHEDSNKVGQFLEWMTQERGIVFASWQPADPDYTAFFGETESLRPQCLNINELLAEYYGVDLKKVEEERRTILDYLSGRWGDQPAPDAKMIVTTGDEVEEIEIKGDTVEE